MGGMIYTLAPTDITLAPTDLIMGGMIYIPKGIYSIYRFIENHPLET